MNCYRSEAGNWLKAEISFKAQQKKMQDEEGGGTESRMNTERKREEKNEDDANKLEKGGRNSKTKRDS